MKITSYNLFYLLIIIISLFACDMTKKRSDTIINLKNIDTKNIKLSSITDSIFYVKLETDSNSLISKISQIEFYKNLLFIRNDYHKLYVFNLSGKFITQIGSKGRGPEEYVQINSFTIDTVRKVVYIFDNSKILSYDFQGNYITSSGKIDQYYNSYYYNNCFYCYTPPEFLYYSKDSSLNMINIVSISGKIINSFLPSVEKTISRFISSCSFYTYNNYLFFIESKSNTLYEADNKSIKIRYKISYGDNNINSSYNSKIKLKSKYVFEFNNYLLLEYLLNNKWYLSCVNKHNNQCVNIASVDGKPGFYDDLTESLTFFPRFRKNNWLIDIIQPYDINKLKNKKNNIFHNIKDSDNPLIRIVVINDDLLHNAIIAK